MNIILNTAYFKAQKRRAGLLQGAGLGLVLLSFVLSFFYFQVPALIFFAYPALLVGWPVWLWARGSSRRAVMALKTANEISEAFKGLSTKYTLVHGVPLDKLVLDHVLIGPDGILLVETKEGGLLVRCKTTDQGDRWQGRMGIIDRIGRWGEEPLGNPTAELDAKLAALRTWLAGQGITRSPLPATGVVAFRNPATPLEIESSKYDVLRLPDLKDYVLQGPPEAKRAVLLPTDERTRIVAALRTVIPAE